MKQQPISSQRGFALVTVLIIAAIGLLFGAGALLLFRFQCQMRIDRQHELVKVYAVRSALNYIRSNTEYAIPERGQPFRYYTENGRDLGLLVKPVKAIFPDLTNPKHLDMANEGRNGRIFEILDSDQEQYRSFPDYEYGANATNLSSLTSKQIDNKNIKGHLGLAFRDLDAKLLSGDAASNVKWWVNMGMNDTGGWLQEDYGRRYYFEAREYVHGDTTKDIMRLCIIRNVTNSSEKVGCRHGWPLSQENERALVFQIRPLAGDVKIDNNNAEMTLSEYVYKGGMILTTPLFCLTNCPTLCYMGMQIADNKVSMFYIDNGAATALSGGYVFSDSKSLTRDTYTYFAEEVTVGNKTYPGIYTNSVDGKVYAPELRAVLEVEAASDMRKEGVAIDPAYLNFLTNFRVTPAYQYDVFLEHPMTVTNRATVAQKIGKYQRDAVGCYTILTYDTHGTEHKGFRRDEREQARERGK